jgi:NitT/TauT family transport system permease protein
VSATSETGDLAARRASRGPARLRASRIGELWPPALGITLLLGGWQLAVAILDIPSFILPSPTAIVAAAFADIHVLAQDALTTLSEALAGYVGGSVLGLGLAMWMSTSRAAERFALPLLATVNSVPMVAFGPVVIIWFGVGPISKIVLIVVVVSYTVLLNTLAGLRSCDPGAIALLRSYGASRRRIMTTLQIPAALPATFSGLKVAVVHSMILAVVIEMLGANSGLGWSIYQATQMMNFVEAWAAVLTAVGLSLGIYGIVSWANRRAVWWQS